MMMLSIKIFIDLECVEPQVHSSWYPF